MKRYGWILALGVTAALGSAAPASAAGFDCEASAVRGLLFSSAPIEPLSANANFQPCRSESSGLVSPLDDPIDGALIFAQTVASGSDSTPGSQIATSAGGIAELLVGRPQNFTDPLPVEQIVGAIPPVVVPGVGTLDLVGGVLEDLDAAATVLVLENVASVARARCSGSRKVLEGASNVGRIAFAGVELDTDEAVTEVAEVIDGATIDPSNLDIDAVVPAGVTLTPALEAAVQTELDAIPPIVVPATIAELRVDPNSQVTSDGVLTQRALSIQLSIAGQQLIDATIGEAVVGEGDAVCTSSPSAAVPALVPQAAAAPALRCTTRRLVLEDVLRGRKSVQLFGVADRRYIGQLVTLHFVGPRGNGTRVARARVQPNGTFRASAKLPPRNLRNGNRARYQARIGRERSLRLKLNRRMIVRSVRQSGNNVRITGRVSRPLANPARTIEVRRRVSCQKWVVVKRIKPSRNGSFSTVVAAPPTALAGTYRLATKVRKTRRNRKTYPTFTLPRTVGN